MNIDWDKAPEGAVQLKQDTEFSDKEVTWFDGEGNRWWEEMWVQSEGEYWWQTIATRPTEKRKTVEDAVEYYDGVWPYNHCYVIKFDTEYKNMIPDFELPCSKRFYIVCTREEFEKAVADKRGEQEWTHITNSGHNCKIHVSEPDVNGVIIVLNSSGEYMRHSAEALQEIKPIKPTITKDEAWDMIISGMGEDEILDTYDIIY